MQDKLFTDLGGERAVAIGRYVADTGATVRKAASVFGISKSTAHKDLTVKLKYENFSLYCRVSRVLAKNKQERHIRGGIATREKYLCLSRRPASDD
ncbi:MAG: sporulation transcriptional regulator SpoIIID [Oscillospiraceae bacterium]|nr:sporulation transcriptional regulator SpoIIID [Oscillospiraceae bacterium]